MKIIELKERWQFRMAEKEDLAEAACNSVEKASASGEWLPAQAPGCVHLDLMAHGKIPDPFLETNELTVQWVERCEWLYKTSFKITEPQKNPARRYELQFDGIDTYAAIFLNNKKIAETSSMFIPFRFDVTEMVKKGTNSLLVLFYSSYKYAKELENQYGALRGFFDQTRLYSRRAQYLTGWDWAPRLSGAGLWRPARVVQWESARILDAAALTLQLSAGLSRADMRVDILCEAIDEMEASIHAEILLDGKRIVFFNEPMRLSQEPQTLIKKISIDEPVLWKPRNLGEPRLHELLVQIRRNDDVLDEKRIPFGIRTIRLNQDLDADGRKFLFEVNGEPVFMKGMNWVPADSFLPRIKEEDYREWAALAARANANCLRVWGGGVYEDDAFYRACDENGIFVWQDFMFSCGEYPEEEWFLNLVRREAEEQIRRLRNHPCVALWCGNNENEWLFAPEQRSRENYKGHKIFTELLPAVCAELDGTRPYWASSPHGGGDPNSPADGDRHNWEVWGNWRRYEEYAKDNGRFISEFGFQSVPRNRTIFAFTQERDHQLNSPSLQHHEKMTEGLGRMIRYLWSYVHLPRNLDELGYYSQMLQGEALKMGIQHWRSRKFKTAGALIWQFNDCWPAISWSLVDYFRRPKASYYYTRRAFAPILAALIFEPAADCNVSRPETVRGQVRCTLVNDLPEPQVGDAVLNVYTLKGVKIFERISSLCIPPNGRLSIGTFSLGGLWITQPGFEFITLRFIQNGRSVSEDTLLLQPVKYLQLSKPDWRHLRITPRSEREYEITLKSDTFIKCVKIFLNAQAWKDAALEKQPNAISPPIPEYSLDDNFFDLIPKQPKTIRCRFESDVPATLFKAALTFQTMNDLRVRPQSQ